MNYTTGIGENEQGKKTSIIVFYDYGSLAEFMTTHNGIIVAVEDGSNQITNNDMKMYKFHDGNYTMDNLGYEVMYGEYPDRAFILNKPTGLYTWGVINVTNE